MRLEAADALFRPMRTGNAFEVTVERLLQVIRLGVVEPGARLPSERELAERLGVSRVTVREAVRSLADAGYVESRRGRYGGAFVTGHVPTASAGEAIDADELEDILSMRRVVEAGAAELAAARDLTPYERKHLSDALADTAAASADTYRRRDARLHLAIAEATGSASLTSAIADVRIRVDGLLERIPMLPPNLDHANTQHAAIVGAILGGDPVKARQEMIEHTDGTAALLRGFLRSPA